MQNPQTIQFHSESLRQICQNLYDDNIGKTSTGYSTLSVMQTIVMQLGALYPNDRNNIAQMLAKSPVVGGFVGKPGKPVPPQELTGVPDTILQRDPDCPSCPPKEVYRPREEAKTSPLPPELLQPVKPEQPAKKKQEDMRFFDGDTVDGVLAAHGQGAVDVHLVKMRLVETLKILGNVEYDQRWKAPKLAEAVLEGKKRSNKEIG